MKILLSNPYYQIKENILKKDLSMIRKEKFVRRFIRRRIVFFMDGYRYAAMAVRRRWGIDFCFFEAGREQVKPVYQSRTLDEKAAGIWWGRMKKDKNFCRRTIKELQNNIREGKKLAKSIPRLLLSPREIEKFIFFHLQWWVKLFEIGFLWFSVEIIKEQIDRKIKKIWKVSQKELKGFLNSVYRPIKLPTSSLEQRDLLKICKLKRDLLERAIEKHRGKYKFLSVHDIDAEYFNLDYYRNRIKALQSSKEYDKTKKSLESFDQEILEADHLIKEVDLPKILKEEINFVRWFIYLRTEACECIFLVNSAYKSIFDSLSKVFSLPIDAVLHMTYKEIINSLRQGKLSISRDLVLERIKRGYAFLIAPHASYLVTDGEIDKLHALVVPEKRRGEIKKLSGQTAFKGKVKGVARVILDRRNAHELKEGEILVTTMTSPEFVPAMKKASGIITNEGGILCHAAIMSRELRKPCIIGTKIATDVLKNGDLVEMDAEKGVIKILTKAF